MLKLNGSEAFLSDDTLLVPTLEDDPLLQHAFAWSDDEDDGQRELSDLPAANRRILALEEQLATARRELAAYGRLVRARLGVGTEDGPDAESELNIPPAPQRDDDTHYFESYGANDIHAVMIQDKVRTSSYASFVLTNSALFTGATVLDVGCGTGILSLFAARAGAARVFAVDASSIAEKAQEIVKVNGLEDTITVIKGKIEDVELPEGVKVDVIISEWMGYALLYESMLDSVLTARDRFLKPEGVLAPSQTRIELALCSAEEIYKERIGFWGDVYGFDMSAMSEEVYREAVVDVVGPDTVLSEPCTIKDMYLAETTPRSLDFTSPFSLTCKSDSKEKCHAFVLYFDTFFSPTGERIPPETAVRVVPAGSAEVAEVWPLRRRASRRASASVDPKTIVTSFSTGPRSVPTHWKQTLFMLREPIAVDEGTVVEGTFHCGKSNDNSRELDVEIHYSVRASSEAPRGEDVIVQSYKIR